MDDFDDWPAQALSAPELAAAALLILRRASWPVDAGAPPPSAVELPPVWGCHVRRLRTRPPRRICDSKDAAASRQLVSDIEDVGALTRRPSPMTPLEYRGGSGASESGSEEMASAVNISGTGDLGGGDDGGGGAAAGGETKDLVAAEREPSVLRILDQKLIPPEHQAMHKSLLEHREFLQKEQEEHRSKVGLVAKNTRMKRLQLRLEYHRKQSTAEEVYPKRLRLSDTSVPLPDLNIPLLGESD